MRTADLTAAAAGAAVRSASGAERIAPARRACRPGAPDVTIRSASPGYPSARSNRASRRLHARSACASW